MNQNSQQITITTQNSTQASGLSMHPFLVPDGFRKSVLNLEMGAAFAPQVQTWIRNLGDPRGIRNVVIIGQAVAASLLLPAFEILSGLLNLVLLAPGKAVSILGGLSLGDYRHKVVRPLRSLLPRGEAYSGYIILDGAGRGLSSAQRSELVALLGTEDIRVLSVDMGQVDFTTPQKGMPEKVLATGLTFEDLTSGRILHLPAGSGVIAAVMATTIYGLSEGWPRCIRLNKADDGEFHVDEIVDCHAMRQWAIGLASELDKAGAPVLVPRSLFDRMVKACKGDEDQIYSALLHEELEALQKSL